MRITRETLLRIAKETAQKRAMSDRGLVAAYLTGSLLTPDPFLGGATDIDLVLVHEETPKVRREIVAVTPEIHLDIVHAARSEYNNPKELRVHPTLGPELYNPMWLYETKHFLEFVQAAVRTKFHDPANVLERARLNYEAARQVWLGMQTNPSAGTPISPDVMQQYLLSVGRAADAIAVLNGGPLAERRFLLEFPKRAEAAGKPGLAAGLLGLLGAHGVDAAALGEALPEWEKAFVDAAGRPRVHASIAAPRLAYYKLAFHSMLAGETPQAVVWPLLHTWTLAAQVLPLPKQSKWTAFCDLLGLAGEAFAERLEGLDRFLDTIEEMLEGMASSQGL
ncbi:MAG: hypothetical protein FD146_244 [Anaerolineaceae bacterium]|nr:MAG: hypothetical protein FD146_244 [Anaerolineaceae bacterium]